MKKFDVLWLFISVSLWSYTQTPICYDKEESETVDFWLEHFYYAKCADFSDKTAEGGHAGGLVYEGNPDYIAFQFYGGLDFDGIYVSKDGTYRVKVVYGIHLCTDPGAGADLVVNGERIAPLVFPTLPASASGTIEFDVNLRAGQANVIQFISTKEFPIFLGIQLSWAEPLCYDQTESETTDFWLEHFYYAKCADYSNKTATGGHAGGMIYEGNPNYIAFQFYGGLDFDGIYVAKDGTYHVEVVYGIHGCDALGAGADLVVNGEKVKSLVFPQLFDITLGTIEFDVDLRADTANLIQLISVKDYPVFSGIQIHPTENIGTSVAQIETRMPYQVSCFDEILTVDGLTGISDLIQIHSLNGQLIHSIVSNASDTYSVSLTTGLYIITVNGSAIKAAVK